MRYTKNCPFCNTGFPIDIKLKTHFRREGFRCPNCKNTSFLKLKAKYFVLFYIFVAITTAILYIPMNLRNNTVNLVLIMVFVVPAGFFAYQIFSKLNEPNKS